MRISDPNETISPFMRTNRKLLRLQISGHEQKNYTVVYFQEGATMDFDEAYDAYQLGSDNSIGFGSYCNDKRLSINGQPASNLSQISIPLYSDFNTPGTYEISIEEFSNFDGNSEIVLEDLLLSTTHLLNSGPYSFEGHPSDGTNRFILNAQLGTSDINILNEELTAIINKCGNALCINFNKPTTDDLNLRIFNVLGQTIFSKSLPKDIEQETIELDLPNHQAYFIELEGDKEVRKIIW